MSVVATPSAVSLSSQEFPNPSHQNLFEHAEAQSPVPCRRPAPKSVKTIGGPPPSRSCSLPGETYGLGEGGTCHAVATFRRRRINHLHTVVRVSRPQVLYFDIDHKKPGGGGCPSPKFAENRVQKSFACSADTFSCLPAVAGSLTPFLSSFSVKSQGEYHPCPDDFSRDPSFYVLFSSRSPTLFPIRNKICSEPVAWFHRADSSRRSLGAGGSHGLPTARYANVAGLSRRSPPRRGEGGIC